MSLKEDLETIRKNLETKKFRETEARSLLTAIQAEMLKNLAPVLEKLGEEMFAKFDTLSTALLTQMVEQFDRITKSIEAEISGVNFTETNTLLKELKDETSKPCEIKLTLK